MGNAEYMGGRFLAWLVLVSSMITLLLGPLACLAVLPTIYLAWLCRDSPKSDQDQEEEEEWLLDRFIGFLRQLDNDTCDFQSEEVRNSLECETVQEMETASRVVSLQSTDSSESEGDDDDDDPSDVEEFVFITSQDL